MKLITGILLLFSTRVLAAGAVIGEPGSCMLELGIYTAHFTVYQSDTRGNEAFCEDLPDTGKALFVLDYLHGSMKEVPVDFRIIRDTDEWGMFARWDNVRAIADMDARTVFYRQPAVEAANRFTAEHDFLDPGAYIGIITAPHPSLDKRYHAVFPFTVGRIDYGFWVPPLALCAVLVIYLLRRQRNAAG